MPTGSGLPELWGAAEIGRHLGVSRQRVQQLAKDRPANTAGDPFPEPAVALDMGKAWLADQVRAWADHYTPRGRNG